MIAENKDYASPLQQNLSKAGLAAIGVAWIATILLVQAPVDDATAGSALLLMVIALGSFVYAFLRAAALARAFAVLGGLRAPSGLWRKAAARFIRQLTLAWFGIGLAGAAQIVLCSARAEWSTAFALSALALCAGIALPLSKQNLLPFHQHKSVLYGLAALLGLVLWFGPVTMLQPFLILPAPLLLAIALAWPAAAWILHQRWQTASLREKSGNAEGMKLWQPLKSYLQRFHPLLWNSAVENSAPGAERSITTMNFIAGFNAILLAHMVPNWLGKPWGAPLSMMNLFVLAVLCANAASALTIRDLHWRSFVMPGGLKRGRIGTSILLATMQIMTLCWLLGYTIVFFFSYTFLDKAPLTILQSFAGHLIALPEMIFVVSCAIAIRASSFIIFGWIFALVALGGWTSYLYLKDLPPTPFEALAVGPAYLACLLGGSAALLAFANRRWTPQRLLDNTRFGMAFRATTDSGR
ncbi:hypothetical protein [Pseudoduganella violacea]|uniref:Uncharacterized protein n=1 Tax=Pseudoduganella violacea TaxID=1715466 RepID=A0A7W5FT90_9BURK|nr:hypothetical protein [Pseudoduganella violacea]MBB3117953.1 hypothetical protein [Pseudoduganella violacea]